jgi:hypothetical protein
MHVRKNIIILLKEKNPPSHDFYEAISDF